MKNILIIGAGKIGSAAAELLSYPEMKIGEENPYYVTLADVDKNKLAYTHCNATEVLDVATDYRALKEAVKGQDAVLSALSLGKNLLVAEVALQAGASYFDLSEDVESAARIEAMSARTKQGQYMVPQCGLAPGFVSILANHMAKKFHPVYDIAIRVGSLPQTVTNALKYNLMWSVDGLINEYSNPCNVVRQGKYTTVDPLSQIEEHTIDHMTYEAFTTSGGIGSLASTWAGKASNVSYKTLRYPGHVEKMKFLMHDLKIGTDALKQILVKALPETDQDKIIILIFVTGIKNGHLKIDHRTADIRPTKGPRSMMTAIQATTAGGVCAVMDHLISHPNSVNGSGFVRQEDIHWFDFRTNRYAQWFLKNQLQTEQEDMLSL